jgi:uncharacterized protein (DUF1697 family)
MVGRNGLTRDVLVGIFAEAGVDSPTSHLGTGNISFGQTQVSTDFSERIEQAIAAVIGRTEPVFIRSIDQLRKYVEDDAFRIPPFDDVHERCVSFTQGSIAGLELPLATARGDAIAFAARDGDIYSVTRLVGGRPGTMGKVLERTLGHPVTTRNWNTIESIVRHQAPGT